MINLRRNNLNNILWLTSEAVPLMYTYNIISNFSLMQTSGVTRLVFDFLSFVYSAFYNNNKDIFLYHRRI